MASEATLQGMLEERERYAAVHSKEAKLREREAMVQQREEMLLKRDTFSLATLDETVKGKEAHLRQVEEALKESERELQESVKAVTARQEALRHQEKEIEQLEAEAHNQLNALCESEEAGIMTLQGAKKLLQHREASLEAREEEFKARSQSHVSLAEQLAANEALLGITKVDLATLGERLAAKDAEVLTLRARLEQSQREAQASQVFLPGFKPSPPALLLPAPIEEDPLDRNFERHYDAHATTVADPEAMRGKWAALQHRREDQPPTDGADEPHGGQNEGTRGRHEEAMASARRDADDGREALLASMKADAEGARPISRHTCCR